MVFGVVVIILAGFMSAVSASEGEGDKNNCESIYNRSLNKDTTDISSVYKAKSILQIRDVKSNLTGAQKKLSTDLLQLLDSTFLPYGQDKETLEIQMKRLGQFRPASSVSIATDGRGVGDMVYVYIYLKPHAETLTIEPYVWEVTDRDEENHLAVAWVEVNDLETLASHEEVRTIRTVMPPILRTGSVTTEGDAIHRTYDVRTTYAQSGSGVKVGIISDGVDNWATARNSGDLPVDLTVLSNTIGGDEGTAMLEIVHDIVPDTDLYFHDCGANTVAFNAAIDALVDAGCDVVCDDIGWIVEPFFEDGTIASHLTSVLASNDIVYVSSAGNAGNKHYQGDYYNDSYQFHDFSRGTEPVYKYLYANIPPNGGVTVVLQWNDEFGSSGNNYDLLLYNMNDWNVLASSVYMQDGDDDPIEAFSYTNTAGYTIEAEIDVLNYFGHAEMKTLEVFVYPNNGASVYLNNIDPADSIFGHPAVPGAIAVGAIDASDPGNDDIEPFSSLGPVTITYPSPVSRPKPDLSGIDGVAVTGAGGFPTPFFGTSAAAPHIAAIAAQVWGAYPSETGDEIRTVLCDTAIDLGSAGYDNIYGYGMTDALAAFGTDATPPVLTIISPTNGASIANDTITVTGTASDASGIASVTVNGALANGAADWSTWSAEVTLTEGPNIITAVATDNVGNQNTTTITIYFESTSTLSIGSATTPPNSTITIPVSVANVTNISGISFDLLYNSSVVIVSSVSANESFTSSSITQNIDNDNGTTRIVLISLNYISASAETPVIDIAFNITGGSGSSTSLDMKDVEFSDSEFNPYTPAVVVDGMITIGIKGDFNGNGRVDIGDVAKVAFMVAGKVSEDLNADFNGNGRVDIGDAAKIAFYLAGKVSEL